MQEDEAAEQYCYFNALPAEIIETIFMYLDRRSLGRAHSVRDFHTYFLYVAVLIRWGRAAVMLMSCVAGV